MIMTLLIINRYMNIVYGFFSVQKCSTTQKIEINNTKNDIYGRSYQKNIIKTIIPTVYLKYSKVIMS